MDGSGSTSPVFAVSILLSRECVNGAPAFDTLSANGVLSPTFALVDCKCDLGWTGRYHYQKVHAGMVTDLLSISNDKYLQVKIAAQIIMDA